MTEIKVERGETALPLLKMAKWRVIPYKGGSRDGQKLWTDVTRPSVLMESTTRHHDSHVTHTELYDLICLSAESIVAVYRR